MKIAGVTGTNGKTTTTFLIKSICEQALHRCGLIGTVRYEVGDRSVPAWRTTPESADLQELLWQMRSAGCKAVAMEVASHALVQQRVRAVEFDAAVFTNLTQDHLDYHGTMEAYFEAKALLFTALAAQTRKKGKAVINLDDRYGAQLASRFKGAFPIHHATDLGCARIFAQAICGPTSRAPLINSMPMANRTSCACR